MEAHYGGKERSSGWLCHVHYEKESSKLILRNISDSGVEQQSTLRQIFDVNERICKLR